MKAAFKKYGAWVRWLVAGLLLVLAIRLILSDPEPLGRVLEAPAFVLFGIGGLVALNQLLMSIRFELAVSQCGGTGVPQLTWFRLTSVGQFLNLFVPQLGNVYRAVILKRDHGISYSSYASGLLAFVWLDVLMGLVIAFSAILVVESTLTLAGFSALALLAAVFALVAVAPFAALFVLSKVTFDYGRSRARLVTVLTTLGNAVRNGGFVMRFFAVNLVTAVVHVLTLWLGFFAAGGGVGWGALMLLQVFNRLSYIVAVTPGNLGINELVYGGVAHATAASLEQGVSVALLMRVIGTLTIVLLGVALGGPQLLFGKRALLDERDRQQADPGGSRSD